MKRMILLIAVALSGCASDTAILRIIEYQAGGNLLAATQGIAVHQTPGRPFAKVRIDYQGERGHVQIESAP